MEQDPEPSQSEVKPKEEPPKREPPTAEQTAKRKALLAKLFRNRREGEADQLLEEAIAEEEEVVNSFKASKFGAFCLQANDLERAERSFEKAKVIIVKRFGVFTNVDMNLGNLWAQRKDYAKAISHYEKVVEMSPHGHPLEIEEKDRCLFSKHLNSFNAYVDAHTNLAVMYVQLDQFEKGF